MKSHPTLQRVVNTILQILPADNIALLAYIDQNNIPYSVFKHRQFEIKDPAELHLLVTVHCSSNEKTVFLDRVEQKCRYIIPSTILLLPTEQFVRQVKANSEFAVRILTSNQLLYQTGPAYLPTATSFGVKPVSDLWYKRSTAFYQTAKTHQRLGDYGMAAFCLHQTTEQLLIFLVQSAIGFKIGSHNLDRLLQHARFYYQEAGSVFAIHTSTERKRFDLLKKSYIHYRYKSDLEVEAADIRYLCAEIEKLYAIADQLFYPTCNNYCTSVPSLHT